VDRTATTRAQAGELLPVVRGLADCDDDCHQPHGDLAWRRGRRRRRRRRRRRSWQRKCSRRRRRRRRRRSYGHQSEPKQRGAVARVAGPAAAVELGERLRRGRHRQRGEQRRGCTPPSASPKYLAKTAGVPSPAGPSIAVAFVEAAAAAAAEAAAEAAAAKLRRDKEDVDRVSQQEIGAATRSLWQRRWCPCLVGCCCWWCCMWCCCLLISACVAGGRGDRSNPVQVRHPPE
jgi:hypothetical protein